MSQKRNKQPHTGSSSVATGHRQGHARHGHRRNLLQRRQRVRQPTAGRPQRQPPPPAPAPSNSLEEIVVTASAQGVKKLDASYNIVSLSLDEIKNANPASAAEIFKQSPGIWPEASGGQTGANIDVAGFPNGGGDSPYFTTMINGSPLYGSPDLSFMDSSSLMRFDDTVERVEIVQGGTQRNFRLRPGRRHSELYFANRFGQDYRLGRLHLRVRGIGACRCVL